jgi:tRNA(Glu) U13 pseudouridine synthase TruD
MSVFTDTRWLPVIFVFAVQFVLFLRWLHRRVRNEEITRVFVQDIALNHLPHIYELLQRLCREQGIDSGNPPIVRWLDINHPQQ